MDSKTISISYQEDFKQNTFLCYQCKKCAVGCPIVEKMDYTPSQLIHLVHLGMKSEILNSKTIWLCVSCHTCTTRCPQGVEISNIIDNLRKLCIAENIKIKKEVKDILIFHKTFLQNIYFFGRLYELGLIGILKFKLHNFFKDIGLGIKMFKKNKIKMFPNLNQFLKTKKYFLG